MSRLHLIDVARKIVVSTCIPCRRLHVSCIGDKTVITATCIHLYPRVEHCLELASVNMGYGDKGYKLLVRDTCIRLRIWCTRGLRCTYSAALHQFWLDDIPKHHWSNVASPKQRVAVEKFKSCCQGLKVRGQGLVNWSPRTRTRTFLEDNNILGYSEEWLTCWHISVSNISDISK